jgi:hypothetical protein
MIARAFPGLATLDDLCELDRRDFDFLAREAANQERIEEIRMAQMIRIAFHAEVKDFKDYIRELTSGIDTYERERKRGYTDVWTALRELKRG